MEAFEAQQWEVNSSTPNAYERIQYSSVGTELTPKHAPAHGSRTPSPLVSVNRRFFKLGSVCRMSSARRLRFAISYQNKRKRMATSPNQRKPSPFRCSYLVRTPHTRIDRCQHPWKTAGTYIYPEGQLDRHQVEALPRQDVHSRPNHGRNTILDKTPTSHACNGIHQNLAQVNRRELYHLSYESQCGRNTFLCHIFVCRHR